MTKLIKMISSRSDTGRLSTGPRQQKLTAYSYIFAPNHVHPKLVALPRTIGNVNVEEGYYYASKQSLTANKWTNASEWTKGA